MISMYLWQFSHIFPLIFKQTSPLILMRDWNERSNFTGSPELGHCCCNHWIIDFSLPARLVFDKQFTYNQYNKFQ